MLSQLKRVLFLLESRRISVSGGVLTFLAIVLARHLLEILAAQNPVYFPIQFYLHYPLAYLAPFLALVLVLHLFSRVRLERVARLMLHVWTLTLLPPLLDLLLGRSGEAIGYLRLGGKDALQVLVHFLDPRVPFAGTTPGIRLETALACLLGGAYVCLRRPQKRHRLRGLLLPAAGAMLGVYLTALGFFTLPQLMATVLAPFVPGGAAGSFLQPPRYLVIPAPLDVLVADHVSLLYLVPLCLLLGALCLLRTSKERLVRVMRRASWAQSAAAVLFTLGGLILGALVKERLEGRLPGPAPVDTLAALGLVCAAGLIPWALRLLHEKDGDLPVASALLTAAFALAWASGPPAASLLSVALALSWVRIRPPLQADGIWLAGPLCGGVIQLAFLGSGVAWAVQTNGLAVLPPALVTSVFLAGGLTALAEQLQARRLTATWPPGVAVGLSSLAGLGAVLAIPLGGGAAGLLVALCGLIWLAAAAPRWAGTPLPGLEKIARLGALALALAGLLGPVQVRQALLRSATQRPKLMVRQGMAMEAQDKPASAIVWYRKALALDPDQARVQARLGELLRLQGQDAEARLAYETALKLDPSVLVVRQLLALLLLETGHPEAVVRLLQAGGPEIEAEPAMMSTLAEALSRLPSRRQEAVAAWRHYLEISRGHPDQATHRSQALTRLRELETAAP